jgi:hypothetical protein
MGMNVITLRKWHRNGGIVLAPFLLLQSISGVFLSFGLHRRLGRLLQEHAPPPVEGAWNLLMAKLHFGPEALGYVYHSLLVSGIIWVLGSGGLLWLNQKRRAPKVD